MSLLALAAALALAASPSDGARSPAAALGGLYRMKGEARVSAAPVIDRTVPVYADAHVSAAGGGAQELRIRLVMQGHACELRARAQAAGAIAIRAGQRCLVVLDGPDARGRFEATLRSGSGRVRGRDLSLTLDWELGGTLSLRVGGPELLLEGARLPAWTPEMPVRGEARGSAEGWRDRSRPTDG